MISQERVSKPNVRDPSIEVASTLEIYNMENNIIFPIKGQPGCLEVSHEVQKRE